MNHVGIAKTKRELQLRHLLAHPRITALQFQGGLFDRHLICLLGHKLNIQDAQMQSEHLWKNLMHIAWRGTATLVDQFPKSPVERGLTWSPKAGLYKEVMTMIPEASHTHTQNDRSF